MRNDGWWWVLSFFVIIALVFVARGVIHNEKIEAENVKKLGCFGP